MLVIGGGYTGCSAALEAACSGASVMVLEADTVGHGGSGRNVGLVNAGLWLPPDDIAEALGADAGRVLTEALATAPDLVFELIGRHGIECEAIRAGSLHLAHSQRGLRDLQVRFRQGNRLGAPLEMLDAAETTRRTKTSAYHGALFDPRAGTIQPLAYCRGLARAAEDAGARFYEATQVTAVRHTDGQWLIEANGHSVRAEQLLIATNAYGRALTGGLGRQFVPVHFSQFATRPLSDAERAAILPGGEGCWDTDQVMTAFRLDLAGRLILGGVGNLAGMGGAMHAAWAARKLARLFPALAGEPFEHSWEGAIAMTADHLPKVVAPGPDALSVFGYSGRGIGPGTVFGRAAARALLTGDAKHLPLAVSESYNERGKRVRHAVYETGAILAHFVGASRILPS
ncbi:NAD(P)/FAD-dependent oxidoreductase [Rhodovulum sulfidophilum]|uniref:NAD(P)/FAD-dependent oxidoreductase n=1 Tax=Rhodovulum sulfidophilum TaxID=35806 RepID=UPI001F32BA24|nr:FAD-binding oxidoreductase [Rhodovulum sulfidophilum]